LSSHLRESSPRARRRRTTLTTTVTPPEGPAQGRLKGVSMPKARGRDNCTPRRRGRQAGSAGIRVRPSPSPVADGPGVPVPRTGVPKHKRAHRSMAVPRRFACRSSRCEPQGQPAQGLLCSQRSGGRPGAHQIPLHGLQRLLNTREIEALAKLEGSGCPRTRRRSGRHSSLGVGVTGPLREGAVGRVFPQRPVRRGRRQEPDNA